jgi:hypothetical protein
MSDLEHQMQKLFQKWKESTFQDQSSFIEDGIIDEERWEKTDVKVLFILREAYQEGEFTGGFNLVSNLKKEAGENKSKATWRNLARWAFLLQNRGNSSLIATYSSEWPFYEESFLSSAIINVKKSGGKKTSDIHEIKEIARRDRDFLHQQIELINSDIICCCGVFGSVEHYWPEIKQIGRRLFTTSKYTIIDYWHPATRWPQDLLYFGLMGITEPVDF